MTAGKIRLRNEEERGFTNDNSEYVEKDDIIDFKGTVLGVNESRDDHASCRVRKKQVAFKRLKMTFSQVFTVFIIFNFRAL